MKKHAPLVAVVILALVSGTAGIALAGPLDSGMKKLLGGDYKGARADLEKVRGKQRPAAQLALIELDVRVGDYRDGEKRATRLVKSTRGATANRARVALAEIFRLTGRYTEARRELEPIVTRAPGDLRARITLALVYRDLGDMKRADQLCEMFFTEWYADKIDRQDARKVLHVAQGARYLAEFEAANFAFEEAVRLDSDLHEASIEFGHFGLEKYAISIAQQNFEEVLAKNPHHPDAHNGMAMVKLEQSYDLAAAQSHLDLALAVNPRHVPSLLTRASMEIDRNQWDAAQATLKQVLAVNPKSFRGRAMSATISWLRDDLATYRRIRDQVLRDNPAFAEFFQIVARSAVREHRYKEAIDLGQEALKIDPEYYVAMAEVGTGYLRLGEEEKGLEWLRKSWKGDEYNARTYNTLELFEKEIPSQYSFVTTKNFKFRYPNDEKEILRRYVEPTLNQAFEDMVKRYGFRPKTPVILELFHDPAQYGVRTVGLPNLGALGVCFGQVITAMSPTVGQANWAMVLWHELAHVFAIQLSNSRVPRWYTEGLSEYETMIARPEWRREHDADVYNYLQSGTLPSVAELNYEFMKPNMQRVVVAYYLSSLTIEHIAQTYGFAKVVDGLKLFAKGKETPEVITTITGKSIAAFDAEFQAQLKKRLAPYNGSFKLPSEGYDDVTKLGAAAKARPDDAEAHAALALGYFFEGNALGSQAAAKKALELDPTNRIALFVSAEVAVRERDLDQAKTLYLRLIAAGGDSHDVRVRLAMIARRQDDVTGAETQLCAAKKLDPERDYPYLTLSEIYRAAGRDDDALKELESYVMLEQMQYGPLKQLVDGYTVKKRWDKVRAYGELALHVNLTDSELYLQLGNAYLETGDPDRALFSFDSAFLVKPALRRPALAHLGRARAHLARKDRRKARAELQKALRIEPENGDALELKKQLP